MYSLALIIFVVSEKKAFEHFPIGSNVNICPVYIIGESLLPKNKGEGMLSDTETEHLLQLDIKEEPRLSPKSQWRNLIVRPHF
jgi:hypothetical protein